MKTELPGEPRRSSRDVAYTTQRSALGSAVTALQAADSQ